MSAGDGYRYLLKSVAAGDGDRSLATPLTRYYAEAGTPPGYWLGMGLAQLGGGELAVGGAVSEAQLELLIGMGHDPVTGEPLGRAYQRFVPVAERVAQRAAGLDPDLRPAGRAREVAAIEAEEAQRGTRRAVAGFDFTFSVPKSVSALWAVADAGTQALIADAHHGAVAELVAFLEREVAATRVGASGPDGAVAHVDVAGVAAAAFDHYDSRSGDPQLHTHVVISNKVRTVQDGKWRTLAGRPMHSAVVAVSELYNAALADHLARTLGIGWEARGRGRDRNPAWEIHGVPEELIAEFSTRSRHIEAEKDRLIADYAARHGRQPSAVTVLKLRAEATLATRPEKAIRSLADLTTVWRGRAASVLGEDATGWARTLTAGDGAPPLLRADDVTLAAIAELGRTAMEAVGERRATWTRWNLHAEASRQLMGWRFASTADREAVTGLVVDAAEQASLRLTPPEPATSPTGFRREDGTSRFRPRHSTLYSSEALLAAEDRLLQRSADLKGPVVPLATVEKITAGPDAEGRMLGEDQAAALAAIAVSGRVVDVLVGPAGAGKTTAMNALRRAWEAEHGTASVIGLAPSAAAAAVLAEDLGIPAENTAKWWHTHTTTGASLGTGQLVIIDEASLAGTASLDRISALAAEAGAKVLLVGDWGQLQSVDAGGTFGMLVHARAEAPELTDIHRFAHAWEKTTSLQLRHGHPEAIAALLEHGRIAGGEAQAMAEAAYTAWRADLDAGLASILIAETHQAVTELNARARAERILAGAVDPAREVPLHDGTAVSEGDLVITRRNDRRLRNRRTWVRNGDRWTVSRIREDGSVTVRPAGTRFGGGIVLPAAYVAEHLDLGYAITAHRAQGITTDTAHTLVSRTTTRENLYVAMTRGRDSNRAYVAIEREDQEHLEPNPDDNTEAAACSVLHGVLQHLGAEPSAREALAAEQERWTGIGQLAAEYETIAQAAQHERWADLLQRSGLTREQVDDVLASDAYGALSAELRLAEANHHHPDTLLPRLVAARGFDGAVDIAATIHSRLARATARPAGSGRTRKPPQLIAGLIPRATGAMTKEMRQALHEREELIEARADAILDSALTEHAPWTSALGTPPTDPRELRAWRRPARVVAAYRDRYQIKDREPLGRTPESTAQRINAARARAALSRIRADDIGARPAEVGRAAARENQTPAL